MRKISTFCAAVVLGVLLMTGTVHAEDLKLSFPNQTILYAKQQWSVTCNQSPVDVTSMPGIFVNEHVMLPAEAVFTAKSLNCQYQYDTENKTVTIQNSKHTIVFTLDADTALVDGTAQIVEEPAQIIRNVNNSTDYVMVPAEFTAKSLGLTYVLREADGSIDLTTPSGDLDTGKEDSKDTSGSKDQETSKNVLSNRPQNGSYAFRLNYSNENALQILSQTDDYHNRQYKITLKGDVRKTVAKASVKTSQCTLKTSLSASGNTVVTLKTKKIRAFDVINSKKALTVAVKAPKDLYDQIVVVDTGHGGGDTGAIGYDKKTREKDLALQFVKSTKKYLDKNKSIQVYYTRLSDSQLGITKGKNVATTGISLIQRINFANEVGADLFISVHINSFSPSANGTEILYSHYNNKKYSNGMNSYNLAQIAFPKVTNALGLTKRSIVDRPNIAVVRHTKMPAILIETGFISNKKDLAKMKNAQVQDKFGKALYQTICDAFQKYPTKRSK